jgi:hypothetical protein
MITTNFPLLNKEGSAGPGAITARPGVVLESLHPDLPVLKGD